jgi:hypothetical protein
MKNARHIRWLYDELRELMDSKVIDQAAADRIRGHYGDATRVSGSNVALTVFMILGSLLVGGGIILLLAHNWEDLTREVRAILSFLPLLAAQGIAFMVIRKQPPSRASLEGSGLFLAMTAAASIALIGQTYNIYGDLGRFLLVWGLLILPIIYLFRSTAVFVLYLACVTGWCGFMRYEDRMTLPYWGLFLAAIPYFVTEARRGRYSISTVFGGLAIAIAAIAGASIRLNWDWDGLWILQYSALFSALYLAGTYWFGEGTSGARKPLRNAGAVGTGIMSFVLTFEGVWKSLFRHGYYYWRDRTEDPLWWSLSLLETGAFLGLAVTLAILLFRNKQRGPLALGVFPLVAMAGYFMASYDAGFVSVILFNVYCFSAGLFLLISGIKAGRLGTANWGLIWIIAIIMARFLDIDMSFMARGLVFILIGSGFLVTNIILARRMRRVQS